MVTYRTVNKVYAMGEVPFSDRLLALGQSVKSHLIPPDDIRVTELPVWPVRGVSADTITNWVKFRAMPSAELVRSVGLIGVETARVEKMWRNNITARMGVARAVGRAVVFGPMPLGVMNGPDDLPKGPEYQFGVRLGPDPVWATPALRLDDGSLRVPEGVHKILVTSLEFVKHELPRVRVY